ncbi:MAG: AraC family transcriptional regulator [Pseudomonadota bacterium]
MTLWSSVSPMQTLPVHRFHMASYLADDEHFHMAHKSLDAAPPQILHDHDYYELLLVDEGEAVHWINGEQGQLVAGDLVFLRPSDVHALQADPQCRIMNIMFRVETAAHLAARYGEDLGARFFWHPGPMPERIRLDGPRFERAVNLTHDLKTTRRTLARIEQYLLSVLLHVVPHALLLQAVAPRWLIEACAAAEDPAVFRAGPQAFVALAGRAHEHVCRQTAQHLGMSPTAFINRLRMQHAAKLLGEGAATIDEVAIDCGISNVSHFYKLFRAQYGTTPRDYRLRRQRDPVRSGVGV